MAVPDQNIASRSKIVILIMISTLGKAPLAGYVVVKITIPCILFSIWR